MAQQAAERIRSAALHVEAVEQSRTRRSPAPPFTTSTLQQEASRKLGFSVRRTMRIAQALGACAVGKLTTICSSSRSFITTTYGV